MWILSICLIAGYPCMDQIRLGLFDTKQECEVKGENVLPKLEDKYKKRLAYTCRELWFK